MCNYLSRIDRMKSSTSNTASFLKVIGDNLFGTCASYIEYSLHASDKKYQQDEKKMEKYSSVLTANMTTCNSMEFRSKKLAKALRLTKETIYKTLSVPKKRTFAEFQSLCARSDRDNQARP